MALPMYGPGDDPGPDLLEVLRRQGAFDFPTATSGDLNQIAHGTTCVAVKFADGVVMAGDRRATSGNLISHRSIEKVFPSDSHSVVAIAGAAGPAVEMVRLFQLQLEHYEKVEGAQLSLNGKANQLSGMLRANLPAALNGLAVVPIFAGYDLALGVGRLFQYDITGGRYEEFDYAATGSGSLHASTVIKLGYNNSLDRNEAVDLVLRSLWEAADEDSATGGPDMIRKIFPIVAVVTADGYERLDDIELEERATAMIASLEENQS